MIIKYCILIGLILGGTTTNLFGQPTPIQTDRPGETESPLIVPKGYFQIENGFLIERQNSTKKTYEHPSTLWKYGLNKAFELRLITELVSEKDGNKTETGFKPLVIGFKVNICQEKGIIPATSFIGHLAASKIGSKEFYTDYPAPSFRFTMQHTLTKKISLGYNLGAEWDGETAEPTYVYTLTTIISLTKKIEAYLEVYGFLPQKAEGDHRIDGGFTYLLGNNLMIDFSGGFGLTPNASQDFISVGLSYRFKTRKLKEPLHTTIHRQKTGHDKPMSA